MTYEHPQDLLTQIDKFVDDAIEEEIKYGINIAKEAIDKGDYEIAWEHLMTQAGNVAAISMLDVLADRIEEGHEFNFNTAI